MKIFSNFDTDLDNRLVKDAQDHFGEEKVLFVRRDKIYLVFRIYVPLFIWLVISILLLLLCYSITSGDGVFSELLRGCGWFIVIGSMVRVGFSTIRKYIDYYMDYTLITPEKVVQYDQEGIFDRFSRSLDISKIKTISVDKKGPLRSIFNYGSIVFFTEGDSSERGDIRLNYISDPYHLRDSITHIMKLHLES